MEADAILAALRPRSHVSERIRKHNMNRANDRVLLCLYATNDDKW